MCGYNAASSALRRVAHGDRDRPEVVTTAG
jgi:hypothetical protein